MRKDPRYLSGVCECCGENMIKNYNFNILELHHIKELSNYDEEDYEKTETIAKKNIACLCPNCHATTHRIKHIPYETFNKKDEDGVRNKIVTNEIVYLNKVTSNPTKSLQLSFDF